jgi:hypothetical protein
MISGARRLEQFCADVTRTPFRNATRAAVINMSQGGYHDFDLVNSSFPFPLSKASIKTERGNAATSSIDESDDVLATFSFPQSQPSNSSVLWVQPSHLDITSRGRLLVCKISWSRVKPLTTTVL